MLGIPIRAALNASARPAQILIPAVSFIPCPILKILLASAIPLTKPATIRASKPYNVAAAAEAADILAANLGANLAMNLTSCVLILLRIEEPAVLAILGILQTKSIIFLIPPPAPAAIVPIADIPAPNFAFSLLRTNLS